MNIIIILLLSIIMMIKSYRRIIDNKYKYNVIKMMTKVADPNIYYINVMEQHPKTQELAIKHCNHYNKYSNSVFLPQHTVDAFQEATDFVDNFYKKYNNNNNDKKLVILDSGCGRGMSTLVLAAKYPNIPIIGIDRSIHRLTKNNPEYLSPQKFNELQVQLNIDNKIKYNNDNDDNDNDDDYENDEELVDTSQYPNAILIQAELATFWMLAATRSDWIIDYHYLLYPNPYPKSKHLKRRWHGHPVFPALLALGGNVIVRSNWPIYCEEFISAIKAIDNSNALNGFKCKVNNVHQIPFPNENESMSHFERKYIRVKVPLFEASAKCGTTDLSQRLLLLKQEQQ